jgi:hypothetical protein
MSTLNQYKIIDVLSYDHYTNLNTVSKAITTLQGDPRNPDNGQINFDKVASELTKSDSLKGRFNRYKSGKKWGRVFSYRGF